MSASPRPVVVVVREDPAASHRPAEALRIAVGLRVGEAPVDVVLLGPGAKALAEDPSSFEDADVLERHREALARGGCVFLVEEEAARLHPPAGRFRFEALPPGRLAAALARADRAIAF